MAQIMKVRCNGPEKHINDVDLDQIVAGIVITRGVSPKADADLRDRYVITCRYCSVGRVIITREMIEDFRSKNS